MFVYNQLLSHIVFEDYSTCDFDFSVFEGFTEIFEPELGLCDLFGDEISNIKRESRLPAVTLIGALLFLFIGYRVMIDEPNKSKAMLVLILAIASSVFLIYCYFKNNSVLNRDDCIETAKRGIVINKRKLVKRVGRKHVTYDFASVMFPDDKTYIKSVLVHTTYKKRKINLGDTVLVYRLKGNEYSDLTYTSHYTLPDGVRITR